MLHMYHNHFHHSITSDIGLPGHFLSDSRHSPCISYHFIAVVSNRAIVVVIALLFVVRTLAPGIFLHSLMAGHG